MGGSGSGKRWNSRSTTGDYRQMDVRRLQRDGLLDRRYMFTWGWSRHGEVQASIGIRPDFDRVALTYTHSSSGTPPTEQNYAVLLDWTDCHYGGRRAWFLCPARGCGRRVAILYCGKVFACRRCYGLAYESQRETPGQRADTRAWAIRKRCDDDWGSLFDPVLRPKGMHHRTFKRLDAQYRRATGISSAEFTARTGIALIGDMGFSHVAFD